MDSIHLFVSQYIKLFFLLTPFFVLTVFLTLTEGKSPAERRSVAMRTTFAALIIGMILFWVGKEIFATLGITLDAFRIGAGSLLFLSAVSLTSGRRSAPTDSEDDDIAVVPLAIPITIGPATIGALLITGAELPTMTQRLVGASALTAATLTVGCILLAAPVIERITGKTGLGIMTKITGLVLSALAAQLIFTGIKNFLG